MLSKPANRIVRAVTDLLWKRDQLQMRAADALVARIERKRRRQKTVRRARAAR